MRKLLKPRTALLFILLMDIAVAASSGKAQQPAAEQSAVVIPLYTEAAPGSEKWDWQERIGVTETGAVMAMDVVQPVLLHYPAASDRAVGTAMIVAPGGGFRSLMMDYEGTDIAQRLSASGIEAFVLKYRLLYTGPGAPPPSAAAAAARDAKSGRYAADGVYKAQAGQDLTALAAEDGRRAIQIVRERAAELNIGVDRVGMIGFSAGGLVTAETLFGPAATRPDFAAIIYGVGEPGAIPDNAPPLFLAVAADDPLAIDRTLNLFTAYRTASGPVELHVFQRGGHGFVDRGGSSDFFMDRLEDWLRMNQLLAK